MNQNTGNSPKFKDETDDTFKDKTLSIVNERLAEHERDNTNSENVAEKIRRIKETINVKKDDKEKDHEHHNHTKEDVSCPGCKKHTLKIDGNVARCTGEGCGDEFLLDPITDKKRDFICTTCGGSITKKDANNIGSEGSCPHCKKGKDMLEIDWSSIETIMKNKKGKKMLIKH